MRFAAEHYGVSEADIAFEPNTVRIGAGRIAFTDLIKAALCARVQLSAAGFYRPRRSTGVAPKGGGVHSITSPTEPPAPRSASTR